MIILLLGLGIYLLFRFREVIPPFIIAVILSYIINPLVNFFQDKLRIKRSLASLFAYLLLIVLLTVILSGVIPLLTSQMTDLNLDFQRITRSLDAFFGHRIVIAGLVIPLDQVIEQTETAIQVALEPVIGQTINLLVEVITSVIWVIFIFVVSFYLIKDSEKIRSWLENLVPPEYRSDYIQLRSEINNIWASFFRGQIVLAVVVAILFSIIGLILGLPFSLAMAVFAGIMEFLPSVGHGVWLVTASFLALFVGSNWLPLPNWIFMLIIIGFHLIYQQFDLNYLIPRIIGRSVHLPPLVVILGIVAGAVLGGVLGILLAAPTIASSRIVARYIYSYLFDLEPYPDSIISPLPPPNPDWWRKFTPPPRAK